MDDNPYAPPKAVVEGVFDKAANAPRIWNPDAAANWCLLFTPIFGMWLHMLNWRSLGEVQRAESAKTWLMLTVLLLGALYLADTLLPLSGLSRWELIVTVVLLLSWYFASARGQAKWVAERFGKTYPRKSWWGPLLGAVVLYVATRLVLLLVKVVATMIWRV